jgi:excisionase family DNA binding protein
MEPKPPRRLLSIKQAQQLVGVSRRTIYNWMKTGKLEVVRLAGGHLRIYEDSLFRPLAKRDGRFPPRSRATVVDLPEEGETD